MDNDDYTDNALQASILLQLGISEEELHAKGIKTSELVAIYKDYSSRINELQGIGPAIAQTLRRAEHVHAVWYRIKEPLHLLKKIIRKKQEYPERHLHAGNYLEYINDLVGVRVMYLYKGAWQAIGNYIQEVWELKRTPYIYAESTAQYNRLPPDQYQIIVKPRGYRAAHYIIKTRPNKQLYYVEIQLKTLFEEGWSEVDHCFRYPDHEPNELMNRLLLLLNQFTTSADAVSHQIHLLAQELQAYKYEKSSPEATMARLRSYIYKLPVDEQEKQHLYTLLAGLKHS